jgi:hypothetical protein
MDCMVGRGVGLGWAGLGEWHGEGLGVARKGV